MFASLHECHGRFKASRKLSWSHKVLNSGTVPSQLTASRGCGTAPFCTTSFCYHDKHTGSRPRCNLAPLSHPLLPKTHSASMNRCEGWGARDDGQLLYPDTESPEMKMALASFLCQRPWASRPCAQLFTCTYKIYWPTHVRLLVCSQTELRPQRSPIPQVLLRSSAPIFLSIPSFPALVRIGSFVLTGR